MKFCCNQFKDMVDDSRIQQFDDGHYFIWTCDGDRGQYTMHGDPDCDKISFCPFCGTRISNNK